MLYKKRVDLDLTQEHNSVKCLWKISSPYTPGPVDLPYFSRNQSTPHLQDNSLKSEIQAFPWAVNKKDLGPVRLLDVMPPFSLWLFCIRHHRLAGLADMSLLYPANWRHIGWFLEMKLNFIKEFWVPLGVASLKLCKSFLRCPILKWPDETMVQSAPTVSSAPV